MEFPVIVSFAQISFHPAYISRGCDLLMEPIENTKTTLSLIKDERVYDKTQEMKNEYLEWLSKKVLIIIRRAIEKNVDVLIFPEYSIPGELLPVIRDTIKGNNIVVIAGTHMLSNSLSAVYNSIGFEYSNSLVCYAACPVMYGNGDCQFIFKEHRSKWETGLVCPTESSNHWVSINKNEKIVNVGIYICIDALKCSTHVTDKENAIIVVPSWSPSLEPFHAVASQTLINELPLVYVNTSEIGGSRIFAPFPEHESGWFSEKDSSKSVPKNSECLVTVELDVANMRRSKATVIEHETIKMLDVSNLVYTHSEHESQLYKSIIKIETDSETSLVQDILKSSGDELLNIKLNEIIHLIRRGTLRKETLSNILSTIEVDDVNFVEFQFNSAMKWIEYISSQMSLLSNGDVLKQLGILADWTSKKKQNKGVEVDASNNGIDEKPFYDRENEITKVRRFFNDESKSILVVQGIRGVGKSLLLEQIPKKLLPLRNKIKIINIKFDAGTGFDLFIDELAFELNSNIRKNKTEFTEATSIVRSILREIEAYEVTYLIIDDFHHVLDKSGEYLDNRFAIFVSEFMRKSSKNQKMIICTNRSIENLRFNDAITPLTLRGLSDEAIEGIIDYHYKNKTGNIKGISIPTSLLQKLHGNPLAAVITANYLENHSIQILEGSTELFKRFQEKFIENLLIEIEFSELEKEVLNFIATSKNDIQASVLYQWNSSIPPLVDLLCSRFILEHNKDKDTYSLHPLVKDFFYQRIDFHTRVAFHRDLALINREIIETKQSDQKEISPRNVSELIYHLGGSLQKQELEKYSELYREELIPIANQLFKSYKYEDALEYYLHLLSLTEQTRSDVLEKIFVCYANLNKWKEAKYYFDEVVKMKNSPYLYAKYAELLVTKTREFNEAESIVFMGEEIYLKSNSQRKWEYAKIKFAIGRISERKNNSDCINYYGEACDLDPTNLRYIYRYAKNLQAYGYEAKDVIERGLALDSNYLPLKDLLNGMNAEHEYEINTEETYNANVFN